MTPAAPTAAPSSAPFDAAIAGGGPAGAACAIALARAGWRVLLADAGGDRPARIGENLPPAVFSLLDELGLRARVLAGGHRPSHGAQSFWGDAAGQASDTLRHLQGDGLQLDRARFDAGLRKAAALVGAQVRGATHLQVEQPAREGAPHHIRARGSEGPGPDLHARWFIDATGRGATPACRLGARRLRHDALLAFHLRLESPGHGDRDGRTWVEAVEDGWWYSVLLPGGERVVAFQGDADLLDRRALLADGGLWRKLQAAPQLRALCAAHGYHPAGAAQGADAGSSELDHAAGHRWLAAGDAALAFDPLSSKGIGNALYTGLRAAQAMLAHEGGDAQAPARYAEHVRAIHRVYRAQLAEVYGMERRWAGAPFWARRHGPGAPPSARSTATTLGPAPTPRIAGG
ncbi:tryptophan 7-halogenase [Acidovorax sp. NCPPB 2350]|nr:tryptophan 7-halogenase [Acidovorax sp. NCPPB 2350]